MPRALFVCRFSWRQRVLFYVVFFCSTPCFSRLLAATRPVFMFCFSAARLVFAPSSGNASCLHIVCCCSEPGRTQIHGEGKLYVMRMRLSAAGLFLIFWVNTTVGGLFGYTS